MLLALEDGKTQSKWAEKKPLGYVDWDGPGARNERVLLRALPGSGQRLARDQWVRIDDAQGKRQGFLGRIVGGPFFPISPSANGASANGPPGSGASGHGRIPGGKGATDYDIVADIEIQGELIGGRTYDTKSRPAPGAGIYALTPDEVASLLGFAGDMVLGTLSGQDNLTFRLQSKNKGVLPRNLGVFGTVGSGKSNTAQVLIEEAAANGWAVIVLDVESEYIDLDQPSLEENLHGCLQRLGKEPAGLTDFHVHHPASCAGERDSSQPFTLRLADFETSVIAEILHTSLPERNALLECVEYYEQKSRSKVATSEAESLKTLLDPAPGAKVAFTLRTLRDRAAERSPRSTEFIDYAGLSTKLMWLMQSGAFDQVNLPSVDTAQMVQAGRVSIIDVSVANDVVKNLVTADLLRKLFAYKMLNTDAPPTILVIEEAHSFISKERAQTMQATLHMLRNVTRRGRKRWLSLAFVSQQPGHLPPEIFELCNTRIVHTLRSMHNLEALMATAGDIGREMWDRCPLLGPGEAVVTSPQLKRPVVVSIRPAASRRKFVH